MRVLSSWLMKKSRKVIYVNSNRRVRGLVFQRQKLSWQKWMQMMMMFLQQV